MCVDSRTEEGARAAYGSHSIGELDKVRVGLVGPREAVLVKQVLPLRNHTLLLVVEHNNLDANVELHSSRHLL